MNDKKNSQLHKILNKKRQIKKIAVGTDSNVLVSGLSAIEVVLGEELAQLWLDAP